MKSLIFLFCLFSLGKLAAADEIIIQPDYWMGDKCLENGVPWQVPGSVYKEAENCTKEDIAFELGSGGSTIFLAQRCKHVTAIETDKEWAEAVTEQINKLGLKNVTLLCMADQNEIISYIKKTNTEDVTIFSVDTFHFYSRSAFLSAFLNKGISEHLKMVVLDNYGDPGMFPSHYNKRVMNRKEWESFIYNDSHWCGKGTRLYIRKVNG